MSSAAAACVMNSQTMNLTLKMEENEGGMGIPLPPPLPPKVMKKGIVSILGSSDNNEKTNKSTSIRRTLSADMSSQKWLTQNGLSSPMKKIASFENFSSQAFQEDDHNKKYEPPTSADVWSSILSQKNNNQDSSSVPPPYIHPLLKKSASSLTKKSLEICTESLGSETGSDQNFPSYPSSPVSDEEKDKQQQQQQQQQQEEEKILSHDSFEDFPIVNKPSLNKKPLLSSPPKSFPPPISSIASENNNKPCVHMQSHRQNGRLILEAVSVPPTNLFRANRTDGRLVLTFINSTHVLGTDHQEFDEIEQKETPHLDNYDGDDVDHQEFDEYDEIEQQETPHLDNYDGDDGSEEEDDNYYYDDDGDGDDDVEEKENEGMKIVLEQKPRFSNGALMMKLEKRNHVTWCNKFNKSINLIEGGAQQELMTQFPQQFNAYEYFWRKNSAVATIVNSSSPPLKQVVVAANCTTPNAEGTTKIAAAASFEQQNLVLVRGNKGNINYLVKGCKEPRRSLLIWEPYCIATS